MEIGSGYDFSLAGIANSANCPLNPNTISLNQQSALSSANSQLLNGANNNNNGGPIGTNNNTNVTSFCPTIDFVYDDTDLYSNEIAELYSYNEESDFIANRIAFEELMEDYGFPLIWAHLLPQQKVRAIERMSEAIEVTDRYNRCRTIRAFLYLAQGNFGDCKSAEEQQQFAKHNIFQLYSFGLFPIVVQLIHYEIENAIQRGGDDQCPVISETNIGGGRSNSIIASNDPNSSLKLLISIVYLFVVEMSQPEDPTTDNAIYDELRQRFKEELTQPIGGELFHITLFEMVIKLCNGIGTKFPTKKILLLLWKVLLLTLGDSERFMELKNQYRESANLKPIPDYTVNVTKRMQPASPPPSAVEIIRNNSLHQRKLNRKFKRQPMVKQSSFGESGSDGGNGGGYDGQTSNNDDNGYSGSNNNNGNDPNGTNGSNVEDDDMNDDAFENSNGDEDQDRGPGSPRPSSPMPEDCTNLSQSTDDLRNTTTQLLIRNKSLPWSPKVRQKEIDLFFAQVRKKFVGFVLPDDCTTTAGLPAPILESIEILRKHLYESLSDVQIKREEDIARYPLTATELFHQNPEEEENCDVNFTEYLYRSMLPNLPQYLISLLKLLLASVSSLKSKSETSSSSPLTSVVVQPQQQTTNNSQQSSPTSSGGVNVLADIMPTPEQLAANASMLQSLKLRIDLNRHQEIIIKSISAILLLLLKHYKINHIYQFEYISQQLMFANCIPLVIKFISQEMADFITSKNSISVLDFPACVMGHSGSFSRSASVDQQMGVTSTAADNALKQMLEQQQQQLQNQGQSNNQQQTTTTTAPYFSWRNMFASINLLRILNKLTKWKNCRIMMLVLFKSAQPLKRALRIRQAMFQVYALKLLKMQAKFLGRQWRKNNMETMSAIYQKVRHRLNDDWAFANDVDSKQLYFQTEEFVLQSNINRFHNRRYEKPFPNNINSVTSQSLSSGNFGGGPSSASGAVSLGSGGNQFGPLQSPSISSSTASSFFESSSSNLSATGSGTGQQQQQQANGGSTGCGGAASAAGGGGGLSSLNSIAEADLFQPVDNNLFSVLSRDVELSNDFKRNYELWLEREVFRFEINWDQLLQDA